MTANIYDQHSKAFEHVAAFVILNATQDHVATIAFKFPRDGAGRLYAYVHWIGTEMVRGFANGYGYDKKSAACSSAVSRMWESTRYARECNDAALKSYDAFRAALTKDDGHYWNQRLETAGFAVLQAV